VRIRYRILGSLLALGLVAAACGDDDDSDAATETTGGDTASEGEGGEAVEGGEIAIALGSEPTSLDPHLVDDGGERAINDNIYETLLTRDAAGELQPGLATELPTQIDDTTWEFTLREGVTFHDGSPFNAESVVATVNRMVNLIAEEQTDNSGFFGTLTGAEAVDDLTVRITTDGPDGVLPARMYWLKQVAADAEDVADLSDAPNGTGPYTFVEFNRGQNITIEANPDYWDGAPPISTVNYEFIAESGTRLSGLLSGQYDLITNLATQDVEQAPESANVQGQEHPVIILDADEGITADPEVRKALNMAVDKEAILESLFGGYGVVDQGQLLSESILGFNGELEPYPYDPEAAAQMLEDAGVAGQTIQLVGTAGRWLRDREVVEAVANYWQEAGMEVSLEVLEFGAYLDVLFDRENRADAIYVSSSNDILDADRQLSTYYQAGGIGSSNSNEELSALIDDGRSETDPDAREEVYNEAVALAYDEAYFVWLVNNADIYGLSDRVEFEPRVDAKLLVKDMSVSS
jgi:peptide/nickel transport system substrate-binding protein